MPPRTALGSALAHDPRQSRTCQLHVTVRRASGRLALVLSRRELLPWTLAGCALGLVEGATAAVLVKRGFTLFMSPCVAKEQTLFGTGYLGYTAARQWGKVKGVER